MQMSGTGVSVVASTKRVLRQLVGLPNEEAPKSLRRPRRGKSGAAEPEPENPWFRTQETPAATASTAGSMASEQEFWPRLRRILLTGLVGFLLVVGAWSVFVRPIVNRNADQDVAPVAAAVDSDSAQAAAARFALDYVSYSPGNDPAVRAAALAGQTFAADAAAMAWTGSGFISATAAVPGTVLQYPGMRAVVMVDVRAAIAAPKKGAAGAKPPEAAAATTTGAPASSAGAVAAPAGGVPEGYAAVRTVWLRLAVPVSQASGQVSVAAGGPVFTGDGAGPDTTTVSADAVATGDSSDWITEFMTAYAASGADYQSAPGTRLAGLGGATTAVDVPAWSLSIADPAGARTGTATVTWKVPGVELSINQSYAVTVTQQADRWYASALGPKLPAPN